MNNSNNRSLWTVYSDSITNFTYDGAFQDSIVGEEAKPHCLCFERLV